jgi:transposase
MNYSIGIDVHASGIHFQIENPDGELLATGKVPKSFAGWQELLEAFDQAGIVRSRTSAFIEATGRHHLPWCERLYAEGFKVYEFNPLVTKRLYSSANAIRDSKTDAIDAATLCEIGRIYETKMQRFLYSPRPQRLGLQNLISARRLLRSQCTNLLKAAGDLLEFIFPEYKGTGLRLASRGFRQVLRNAPTPEKLRELPVSVLGEAVGDKAEKLQQAAQNSITPEAVAKGSSVALVELLDNIDSLFRAIEKLDQTIENASSKLSEDKKRQMLIRSLPGFGEVTVPVISAFLPADVTEWVPRNKKRYKKKLAAKIQAFMGAEPRLRESGKYKGKIKVSKRGVEALRTAFYQASFCSLMHDPQMNAYYQKKKAEGDHHNKAMVDVVRKNLRRLVSVLVNETPYEFRSENV